MLIKLYSYPVIIAEGGGITRHKIKKAKVEAFFMATSFLLPASSF
jgi:hypothetical protein